MPTSRHYKRLALVAIGLPVGLQLAATPATAQSLGIPDRRYTTTVARRDSLREYDAAKQMGAIAVDEQPHLEYAPHGIRIGDYVVFPSVETRAIYDDNIYGSGREQVGDFRYEVAPELVLQSQLPRHLLDIMVGGRYVTYAEHGDQDFLDAHANVQWRLDIDHANALGGEVASVLAHEERLSEETPLAAAEAVEILTNKAVLAFTHDVGQLGGSFGIDAEQKDFADVRAFDGSSIDQDFRDRVSLGAFLDLTYRFSPGYTALASLRVEDVDYELAGDGARDALIYGGKTGIGFELSPLWRATVMGGYAWRDYRQQSIEDFGAYVYEAGLEWLASPVVTVSLAAGQRLEETSFENATTRLDSGVEGRIEYEALRNLKLSLDLGYGRTDFSGTDRVDDTYSGGLGAEYTVNENLIFTFSYEHRTRDSSDQRFEGEENRYLVGAKLRF